MFMRIMRQIKDGLLRAKLWWLWTFSSKHRDKYYCEVVALFVKYKAEGEELRRNVYIMEFERMKAILHLFGSLNYELNRLDQTYRF